MHIERASSRKPFNLRAGMMRRSIADRRDPRATQNDFLPAVAIGETAPTYREGSAPFCVWGHIHRPLKKTAFLAILAFDTLGPRTYNPRPRCFAA